MSREGKEEGGGKNTEKFKNIFINRCQSIPGVTVLGRESERERHMEKKQEK